MCVKLPPRDLNLGPCSPHPTCIYTYGVTTEPRVRGHSNDFSIQLRHKHYRITINTNN